MHLKGELTAEQDNFMQPIKPVYELYDLENDPYELYILAGNQTYSKIEQELKEELSKWQERINDRSVSAEFRPGGWPADYPIKTLEEWEHNLELFKPWVFREPTTKMKHPVAKPWKKKIIK